MSLCELIDKKTFMYEYKMYRNIPTYMTFKIETIKVIKFIVFVFVIFD